MTRGLVRGLLWWASASLLLAGGFVLFVMLASRGAAGDAESLRETRAALTVYAKVVFWKGLLPQLWLGLALWPLLDRWVGLSRRGRKGIAAGLGLASLLSGLVVAPTLLTLDLPGSPAVVFRGAGNFVASVLQMSAAVAAASLLPRLLLPFPSSGGSAASHA